MKAFLRGLVLLAFLVTPLAGCGQPTGGTDASASKNPVDSVEIKQPVEVLFWHRQTGESEKLQQQLIDEFNAKNPNIKVKAETLGDYTKLYQKVMASIQAGSPPDIAATYESMAADYMKANAIVSFDDYISSTKYGLSKEDLADIVPSYLDATIFPLYGNKKLTFPYTKSALVMYTNMELLKSLGFSKPAETWDDFLKHTRAAVAAGKQGYAMNVDTSTVDGIVFSFGGEVIGGDGKKVLYDSPAAMKTLQLYDTLAKEGLAYQVSGYDDQNDLAAGKALYMIRSSSSLPFLKELFKDDSKWTASIIPQGSASGAKKTVLYGGNVSMFKSTPEKQLASWQFIKWFASREVTARWGADKSTGYFPVRLSALNEPAVKEYIATYPQFKDAIEASKYGKVEPSAAGWQEIRDVIKNAVTAIVTKKMTPEQASKDIVEKGNKILAEAQ